MTTEKTETAPDSGAVYTLWVDDNFHYMDESERYCAGRFATLEEAIAKVKKMVLENLESAYEPGMSAEELYRTYVDFGEDPWIDGPGGRNFSAWTYAKELAEAMTAEPVTT